MGIKTKFNTLMAGIKIDLDNVQRSMQENRAKQLKILRDIRNRK